MISLTGAGAQPERGATTPPTPAPAHSGDERPTEVGVGVVRVEHRPAGEVPTLGARHAPVQLELFFLPGASSSRLPVQLAIDLWRNHPSRVRVVFRVLSRQGQVHLPAAALEAAAQGKFVPFIEAVGTRLRGTLPAQIRELAQSVGVDVERLDAAWADSRHLEALDDNELRRSRMRARQIPDVLFSGKLASRPVTVLGAGDFEAAYREAYERALEALDRGVAPSELAEALEREVVAARQPPVIGLGPADERSDLDEVVGDPGMALLTRPVSLRGLPLLRGTRPTTAPRSATEPPSELATTPIIVACNPLSVLCYRQLQLANVIAGLFDRRVRVVWAPMFDPRGRDAIAATRAADAVLCAEALGSGWAALDVLTAQTNRRRGRAIEPDRLLEDLIAEADLDSARLAACMAVRAGESVRRAGALRAAGMTLTPTMVVGGRMYPGGVSDAGALQTLIEYELADGWLGRLSTGP